MHVVPLNAFSASVMEPVGHSAQAVVDITLIWPALHAVHKDDPDTATRLATDPERHNTHADVDVALY